MEIASVKALFFPFPGKKAQDACHDENQGEKQQSKLQVFSQGACPIKVQSCATISAEL